MPTKQDFRAKFACKASTSKLSVGIKYSMNDQICNVISFCAWSCDRAKM